MKYLKSILFIVGFLLISTSFSTTSQADEGDCYLNAYQRDGEMCFICTERESANTCTSSCGSETCWEVEEN